MKSISLYVDNGSWLCRVHPFTKLAYIVTAISVPLIGGTLWLFAAFIALSLAVLASGHLLRRVTPLVAFSFTILITIFLIHGLFNQNNQTPLFQIVPQMMGTMSTITDAQRSRGMETEGNLLTRAKAFLPLISPVVMSALINTRERAVALEVRGFAAKQKKTYLADRTPHRGDKPITIALLALIVLAAGWRIAQCL